LPKLIAITLPSLGETLRKVGQGLNAEYRTIGLNAFKTNNLLFGLRVIIARVTQQLYLLAREAASQATPFGATGSNLDDWLDIRNVQVPPEATATGSVEITGINASLDAGTELASSDGYVYTLDSGVVFSGVESTTVVNVNAVATGADYNRAPGDILQIDTADDGINPDAVVVTLSEGSNPADDVFKETLLQASWSQGDTDRTLAAYRTRSLTFNSQFREVYVVSAALGAGTVGIFPTNKLTGEQADYEVNVASAAQVAVLQAHLEQDTVRGTNDRIFVKELVLLAYTFEVSITPDTADTRAAVIESIGTRLAEGYTLKGYTIANSEISAAIGSSPGVESHTLDDVNGEGAGADVVALVGELANLGDVTFS